MARPPLHDEPRVTTAVRLPSTLHERLRTEAAARDVSVNLLITRAVGEFLERLVPVDELTGTRS